MTCRVSHMSLLSHYQYEVTRQGTYRPLGDKGDTRQRRHLARGDWLAGSKPARLSASSSRFSHPRLWLAPVGGDPSAPLGREAEGGAGLGPVATEGLALCERWRTRSLTRAAVSKYKRMR